MFCTLAQEKAANAEATVAAREKKAAKKARRKERDAALKAVDQPRHAPSVASSAATEALDDPETGTDIVALADTAVASAHAEATAAQAAGVRSGSNDAADSAADAGSVALPDVSVPTSVNNAMYAHASGEAAPPAAPAEAGQLLPPAVWELPRQGGDWADLEKPQLAPHAGEDDISSELLTDAGGGRDVLGQLLGHLGVSKNDRPHAQPHETEPHAAKPTPELETALAALRAQHAPAAGAAGDAMPLMGDRLGETAGRRRAAAPQSDPFLLCPITQVCIAALPRRCA